MSTIGTAISASEGLQAVNPELAKATDNSTTLDNLKNQLGAVSEMNTIDEPPRDGGSGDNVSSGGGGTPPAPAAPPPDQKPNLSEKG